jgi:SWI/SNF related-matrix-associated actin-dependent regulator of chromatin subfamily C
MCKDLFTSLVLIFSQVAFLAAEVGPRVAASCANATLLVLTRDDSR